MESDNWQVSEAASVISDLDQHEKIVSNALASWRQNEAFALQREVFIIFPNKALCQLDRRRRNNPTCAILGSSEEYSGAKRFDEEKQQCCGVAQLSQCEMNTQTKRCCNCLPLQWRCIRRHLDSFSEFAWCGD